jgi:serine protease inhibitor
VTLPTFGSGKFIPFTDSPSSRAAIDANTVFALDVYRHLRNQSDNVFFSPYSISTALAMVYAGARGQTETEMAGAMHLSLPADETHKAFQAISEHLDDVQSRGRITLLTANSAWCEKNYSLNQQEQLVHRRRFSTRVCRSERDRNGSGINNVVRRESEG